MSHAFNYYFTDSENPTIQNVPSDVTRATDSGLSTALVTWAEPTATDNTGSVTLTSSHSSGSSFAAGTTTVKYTAVDDAGNTAEETFTVTIQGM